MYTFLLYKMTVNGLLIKYSIIYFCIFVIKYVGIGLNILRQMSVILGHPISTGFHRLTGCQRDPRAKGVISSIWKIADVLLCTYTD